MNVSGNAENQNVISLFGNHQVHVEEMSDPLQDLLNEIESEAWEVDEKPIARTAQNLVTENHFPDQSMFILEKQLANLTESLGRLRFYLSDLDDLLPR